MFVGFYCALNNSMSATAVARVMFSGYLHICPHSCHQNMLGTNLAQMFTWTQGSIFYIFSPKIISNKNNDITGLMTLWIKMFNFKKERLFQTCITSVEEQKERTAHEARLSCQVETPCFRHPYTV